jgi:hypothetical protein
MLVISHPDDEVMFFGPTVLGLIKVQLHSFLLLKKNLLPYRVLFIIFINVHKTPTRYPLSCILEQKYHLRDSRIKDTGSG